MGEIVLIFFAVVCAVASLSTVLCKRTISNALSLLVVLFSLACIYAMVGAHFVAGMQLIVYAGAVMVLFIFTIMLLNPALMQVKKEISWKHPLSIFSIAVVVLSATLLSYSFLQFPEVSFPENGLTPEAIAASGGNVHTISSALFTKYFIPFDTLSILLLVAMVGAIVLAKRKVDA